MPTTLRLGFAMGGGVSLGTFCGAALSQAIKLILVHGRNARRQRYAKVEIDVFSGASAGALSLAAMLRYLLHRTAQRESDAASRLRDEFGPALKGLSKQRRNELIAAEVVHERQQFLWSQEIKLSTLLGKGGDGRLRHKASLLDRGAIEDIARRHLVQWEGMEEEASIQLTGRRLLAERVVFACTLANLTPIIADASASLPTSEAGFAGLADGLRSHTHRDLRVFDLHFGPVEDPEGDEHPHRWCRYHNGEEIPGKIGDLRQPRSWAKIAATAIASGAVPLAFEPVVLRRRAYEFGKRLWLATFGKTGENFDPADEFPFTYVDGGTFNNEPIREAFRLASFIDSHRPKDGPNDVERLIVFVDPDVSDPVPVFNLPVHRQWALEEPNVFGSLDGFDLRRRASLDRLVPHVGSLLGTLIEEGRVIEADKVAQVRDLFKLRKDIRDSLHQTLADSASEDEFQKLVGFAETQLKGSGTDEMIPPGPLTPERELERVIAEEPEKLGKIRGQAAQFLESQPRSQAPNARLWLRALSFVAVDLILGLEGKFELAKLVAIAPFHNVGKDLPPVKIELPGERLAAFGGFMSDIPDEFEFSAAKRCAAEFLRACKVLDPATPLPEFKIFQAGSPEEARYARDIELGLNQLADRAQQMVQDSHLINVFPGVDALLRKFVGKFVGNALRKLNPTGKSGVLCEFRIRVSDQRFDNQRFELDGAGRDRDSPAVSDPDTGQRVLITLATFAFPTVDFPAGQWSGGFVHDDGLLHVDRDGAFKGFCKIELPGSEQVRLALSKPTPLFVLELKPEHEGTKVPASLWELQLGVLPLEDALLVRR